MSEARWKTTTGKELYRGCTAPEAGVVWTGRSAVAAVQKVLGGDVAPGFQTPGSAYGADFVLKVDGVTREDLPAQD